jgi:hypothetical protein
MAVFNNLLLWVHLIAWGMGMGGGLGLSQVGPRLIGAAPDQRAAWWPMAEVFSRISALGLVLLLITGPLMLWLKYDGGRGLNVGFHIKMALVLVGVVTIGLSHWGKARLKRGDEGGGRLMMATGPLTTMVMLGVVLAAVVAFN